MQMKMCLSNLGTAISLTQGCSRSVGDERGKIKDQVHNSTANLGHPATKRVVLTGCGEIVGSKKSEISGEAQVVELIATLIDHLVLIDPNIAFASEHIDVGLGGPVRVGLTAVRIAEGQMHAGEFFVLE